MSKSTHQIAVKATDQTAGAFASIQTRAAAASAKLRSMLGGALAAAGAYMGLRQIAGGIKELGKLSDIAQKTSTSVDELTQSATAMNILGIQNMGVEQMAKAFDYMAKTTGRTGMEGFYQTIQELGKIPDVAERSEAAMKVFGRSGMEFMPLINAADTSVDALKDVVDVMPGIPQSAANAGDDAADAMDIMQQNVKSIWLQGIAAIVGWFGKNYEGGIRGAALNAANSMIYYSKLAVQKCMQYYRTFSNFMEKVGGWVGDFVGTVINGGSLSDALKTANDNWEATSIGQDVIEEKLRANEEKRAERWKKDFEDRETKIKRFGKAYDKATRTTKDRQLLDAATMDKAAGKKIQNDLILGGSAKSNQLAMMGPQLNSDMKDIRTKLDRIAKNTENVDRNTRDDGESENYEVMNG